MPSPLSPGGAPLSAPPLDSRATRLPLAAAAAAACPARRVLATVAAAGCLACRFPVTSVLVAALVAARVMRGTAPELAHRWQWATSTTLDQLVHHPLGVLLGSIPWVTEGPVAPWVALAGLAVGGLEYTVGSVATFAVLFGGHTGATLISEGILGLRVAGGQLPTSALHILDVGPSYVVAASLAAVVVLPGRHRLRTVARIALVVILPAMTYGVVDVDLDSVGHIAAFSLGALAATVPALRRRADPGHEPAQEPLATEPTTAPGTAVATHSEP
ncbi:rhomboid-like protein [Frankia sp. AgKG'84/4]|uniref:rhomboid-like protein n=1 Tax=Frankia sp. AgKG'84/4 TaxID=573490 RepID=UPI00200FE329|nr:rhomboid-like protein [Frankia sp. AgKG'84/4]MCL9793251.1 hypothetical protein [Frankia sp. AgKG'84/4]